MFDLGREIIAVVLVLGILGGSLIGLRRFQKPREGGLGPLRVLAKLRLSEHLAVHLIDCAGERCLVTEPKNGSSVISWRPESGSPPFQSPEASLPEGLDPKLQTKRAAAC